MYDVGSCQILSHSYKGMEFFVINEGLLVPTRNNTSVYKNL